MLPRYHVHISEDERSPLTCQVMRDAMDDECQGNIAADSKLDESIGDWSGIDEFVAVWTAHMQRHGPPPDMVRDRRELATFLADPLQHDRSAADALIVHSSSAAILSDVDPRAFPHLQARVLTIHLVPASPDSRVPESWNVAPLLVRLLAERDGPRSPIKRWFDAHADLTLATNPYKRAFDQTDEYLDLDVLCRCLFLISVGELPTSHLPHPLSVIGRRFRVVVLAPLIHTASLCTDGFVETEAYHTREERDGVLPDICRVLEYTGRDDDRIDLLVSEAAACVAQGDGVYWDDVLRVLADLEDDDALEEAATLLLSADWLDISRYLPDMDWFEGLPLLGIQRERDTSTNLRTRFFEGGDPLTPLYTHTDVTIVDPDSTRLKEAHPWIADHIEHLHCWPTSNQIDRLGINLYTEHMTPELARILHGNLSRLDHLQLFWWRAPGPPGSASLPHDILQMLAINTTLKEIDHLHLENALLDDAGLERLITLPLWERIETAALEQDDERHSNITDVGLGVLAASPVLQRIEHLNLCGSRITDAGLQALMDSPHQPERLLLMVANTGATEAIQAQLAASGRTNITISFER